ncbi:MAG: ribosome small subunit-dependent GTPase A [Bacteroidales bacterium]|nr:ribosome small subunit-dependent GTPase A [Bacteroidales bacterium]
MKKGLIIKTTGSWHTVKEENGEIYDCKIRGKFRIKGIKTTNPIAVGDYVEFDIISNEKTGVITNIIGRKNYLIRKSVNLSKQGHIIAANIDTVFLIVTLKDPETTTLFIDRFLISAEAYRIPVIIVFNKIDIYDEHLLSQMKELINIYSDIGYKCYKISATQNINIDNLKDAMKGKVNVISGHSGVGKSTIINSLDKNLNLKIAKISDYHKKGKHTTAYSELFEFEFGGYVVDTPGIKAFGIIDMYKEEIFHFFPEIFKISKNCKYYNCTHTHEPECAVKKSVEDGIISSSRYINYLKILDEDWDEKYRKPF